jgi:hypothetical protein
MLHARQPLENPAKTVTRIKARRRLELRNTRIAYFDFDPGKRPHAARHRLGPRHHGACEGLGAARKASAEERMRCAQRPLCREDLFIVSNPITFSPMSDVINLTLEKQNRVWEQLNKTWAKVERSGAALDAEILRSRLKRVRRKRRRKAREASEAKPPPRLTVVLPE